MDHHYLQSQSDFPFQVGATSLASPGPFGVVKGNMPLLGQDPSGIDGPWATLAYSRDGSPWECSRLEFFRRRLRSPHGRGNIAALRRAGSLRREITPDLLPATFLSTPIQRQWVLVHDLGVGEKGNHLRCENSARDFSRITTLSVQQRPRNCSTSPPGTK